MTKERLFSLDLLRGFDMFLLTVIGPLVVGATRAFAGTFVQGMPRIFGATAQPFVAAIAETLVLIWLLTLRRRLKAR